MAKSNNILVKDTKIKTLRENGVDYICITDIARQKNSEDPNGVIANWMRNRNTIEFLGIWEELYNPCFNPLEFEGFRRDAGLNAFTLSPTKWIESTNAIGLKACAGRYGGTYAVSDIAFEFASWISVEFKLYLVKEFQRLKDEEQKLIGWTAKPMLCRLYKVLGTFLKRPARPTAHSPGHRPVVLCPMTFIRPARAKAFPRVLELLPL